MSKGRFFAALAGFLIVLLAAQVLLGAFCGKLAIPSVFDTLLMECTHPGIVYVGDSALRARPPEFVLLPDMLAELRPDDTVFGYPLLGADPRLQYEFVRKLLKSGPRPTAVIVGYHPAMMVSQWNVFEEGQDSMLWHARLSCSMLRSFTRPAAVFKFFHVFSRVEEEKAETKHLEDMIAYARGLPPGKGAGDFAHLPPDAVPEGARYVYKMAKLLKTHDVPAVLYLSPINIERAERVYGGDQKAAAEAMARYVQEQGERGGIPVHNWMFEGKEDEFEPAELVSVHMLSGLQRRIADKVNVELDKDLPRKSRSENVAPDPANGGTGLRSDKAPHKASCSHCLQLSPTAQGSLFPDEVQRKSAEAASYGQPFMKTHTE